MPDGDITPRDMRRYRLSPAWHVLEVGTDEYGQDRDMAAASSAADGEMIVDALNQLAGAVEEIEEVIRLLESASPQQLPDKALSARVALRMLVDRLGGQ